MVLLSNILKFLMRCKKLLLQEGCFVYLVFPDFILLSIKTICTYCSKSEYVRCLRFTSEESLYVATNQGYLYHATLCETEEVKWTKLVRVGEGAPIVCMDLLAQSPLGLHSGTVDWVAVGDGKGRMTVVRFVDDACFHKVGQTLTWSAEAERQLLGAYWSKALGCR